MPRLSLRADAGVGAIAVSPTSRDAVLAGRSGLYIVDLHDPFALPRWLPLRSAWEVASVQWCPHPNRPACLVSSSNQKALVWNLALPSEKAIEHVLHGHRRAVTDISFSPLNRDLLATSSIDTTLRLWDLRQADAATMTFADFNAGMMQCHWDPTNEHQLATAQAARISIWDKRKANQPVAARIAHDSECNGLEYFSNGKIITCSTDRKIKVWDMKRSDNQPDVEIEADFPLWRALPTPYEYGAFIVPLRGGQNRVSLINLAGKSGRTQFSDVQMGYFEHQNKVKSAVYMRTDQSSGHYDLMTWCHDSHLREWKGDMLQKLPHASLGSGCKDDIPPELPSNTRSFNTDEFDNKFHNLHGAGKEVFDLPILNRKNKDKAHTISQFDWIAGVHISKTGLANSQTQLNRKATADHRSSELVQEQEDNNSSQIFSQEIIAVSARFPRVLFEDINIGMRTCVLSMFGPWGPDSEVINISLNIKAPVQYPNQPLEYMLFHGIPHLSEAKYGEISEFLATSALKLSQHSMHSLEFCVRYLVGDPVSIEDHLSKYNADVPPLMGFPESEGVSGHGICDDPQIETEDEVGTEVAGGMSEDDGVLVGHLRDNDSSSSGAALSDVEEETEEEESTDQLDSRAAEGDAIIDSTPLPKSCGGVWSVTGQLICFFNHKPVKKDRGPLPLDKVFADESDSDGCNAPFLSDSDDFELHEPQNIIKTTNWAVTAAQLNASSVIPPRLHDRTISASSSAHPANHIQHLISNLNAKRSRARTVTTATSDDNTVNHSAYPTHTVVIHNLLHLWPCRPDVAADYHLSRSGSPLAMAQHNVRVAGKYGLHLHVYVWKLLIDYIKSELESCNDPIYVVTSNQLKFEWSGASVGLGSFLPQLASYLEAKGEVQLLVSISMILSALRAQRHIIKQETVLKLNRDLSTLPIMESETETFFHATNGQITMLDRPEELVEPTTASSYWNKPKQKWTNRLYSLSPHNSPPGANSSWLDPDLSSVVIDGTTDESPLVQPQQQHHQYHQPVPHGQQQQLQQYQQQQQQHQQQQLQLQQHIPGTEPGFYFSFEITNSALFEFSYPHRTAGVHARPKSTVLENFTEWLPRLRTHRTTYASLLHTWGLSMQRAEVAKPNYLDPLVSMIHFRFPQESATVEISTNDAVCAFCSQPMTRLLEFCGYCSHAMHCACAQQWWSEADVCPAACGCSCKRRIL